jgi:hypothetical protein
MAIDYSKVATNFDARAQQLNDDENKSPLHYNASTVISFQFDGFQSQIASPALAGELSKSIPFSASAVDATSAPGNNTSTRIAVHPSLPAYVYLQAPPLSSKHRATMPNPFHHVPC